MSTAKDFDWMATNKPNHDRTRQRRVEVIRREVQQRAALLMSLGHSKAYAIARCRQNLAWDYEMTGGAPLLDEVEGIVNAVASRTLTLDPRV